MLQFKILQKDKHSKARAGKLMTPHGIIKTPAFVPCGTRGSVRGLSAEDLKEINVHFLVKLTEKIRESILEGKFSHLKKEWLD